MSEKEYYNNPYCQNIETEIVEITTKGLVLSSTISYPEGGGQPGDSGTINASPYSDTQLIDSKIVHVIESEGFKVGEKVKLTINWSHRYFFMKQHTAQHMLSGLFFTLFNIGTVSVHQGVDILTIETDKAEISQEILFALEDAVNQKIRDNHKVTYLSHLTLEEAEELNLRRSIKVDSDVRIVQIEGVDQIACGGLHVNSTAEVEQVCYVGQEVIRGHVRTIWKVADKAKQAMRQNAEIVERVGQKLSAQPLNILSSLDKLWEEKESLASENRKLIHQMASLIYESHKNEIAFISPIPVSAFVDKINKETFILYEGEDKANWLYYGTKAKFQALLAQIQPFGVKGGGREPLFQGMVKKELTEQFFNTVKEKLGE